MQSEPVIYTINAIEEKETTDIDHTKLISYLNKNMCEEQNWNSCKIYRCTSGYSNAPYILKCGSKKKYVLRTKHDDWGKGGKLLNHDIDRQYKLISLLYKYTNIPVPRMYIFCNDKTVIGKTFYIMEFIQGRVFTFIAPDLPTLPKHERGIIYNELVRVLSLIHSVNIYKTGIADVISNDDVYVEDVYNVWENDLNDAILNDDKISQNIIKFADIMKRQMVEYKNKNKKKDLLDIASLIHGDFHFENIIWHPVECRIIAVVDWECCGIGNPLFDLCSWVWLYHGFETEEASKLDSPMPWHNGFKYVNIDELGIPSEIQQIIAYLNYSKKVVSPLKIEKMISWLKIKNNWAIAFGVHMIRGLAGFYQIFKDLDEESRIQQAFGNGREYVVLDSFAQFALPLFQEKPLKLLLSKL